MKIHIIQSFIARLALLLLIIQTHAVSAQNNDDKGRWYLVNSAVTYDGQYCNSRTLANSNNYLRAITRVENNLFELIYTVKQEQRMVGGSDEVVYNADGSLGSPAGTLVITNHYNDIKFEWSDPKSELFEGEENSIYFDYQVTAGENIPITDIMAAMSVSVSVAILPSLPGIPSVEEFSRKLNTVSLTKEIEDFMAESEDTFSEFFEQVDGEDYGWVASIDNQGQNKSSFGQGRISCKKASWNAPSDLKDGSMLMVTIESKVVFHDIMSGAAPDKNSVIKTYLYKYVAPDRVVVVSTPASNEAGEEDGPLLPPWIWGTIGGFVLIGGAKKVFEKKEKPEKEEPKKGRSSYKMVLYKDFGDTLNVGDEPQIVGARIDEILPDGTRVDRPDLTAQIDIIEGDNIRILARGMSGRYRSAKIFVPESSSEAQQAEVHFSIKFEKGSFTNKYIFNIGMGEIMFAQDNLTLPVGYDKVARLPFYVKGMQADNLLRCECSIGKDYIVTSEPSDESPLVWYAVIQERNKKPLKEAGDRTCTSLEIKAIGKNGTVIEGSLLVIRLQLGLFFQCSGFVQCYLEKFDPVHHSPYLNIGKVGKDDVSPSQTFGTFSILGWNEETNSVIRSLPDADVKYDLHAEPLDPEEDALVKDYLSKSTRGMTDKELIDRVQVDSIVDMVGPDNTICLRIFSHNFLDSPSRRKVKLVLNVKCKGVVYTAEQKVWLVSQPYRDVNNDKLKVLWKHDEDVCGQLNSVADSIHKMGVERQLFPVLRIIEMMQEAYDPMFGFDEIQVKQMRDVYNRFCKGEIIGANAEPEKVEDLGFLAETMRALATSGTQIENWMQAHGGFATRLTVCVLTMGWSEAALSACDIQKKMIEVAERDVNPGGAWEAFTVGVTEYGKNVIQDALIGGVFKQGKKALKARNPILHAKLEQTTHNVGGWMQKKLGYLGKDLKDVGKDIKSIFSSDTVGYTTSGMLKNSQKVLKNAEVVVDARLRDCRKPVSVNGMAPIATDQKQLRDSLLHAKNNINDFEKLNNQFRVNPTPENASSLKNVVAKLDNDPAAKRLLTQNNSAVSLNTRVKFEEMQKQVCKEVELKATESIVSELNIKGVKVDAESVYVFHPAKDAPLDVSFKVKANGNAAVSSFDLDVPMDMAQKSVGQAYQEVTGLSLAKSDYKVLQSEKVAIVNGELKATQGLDKMANLSQNNACPAFINEAAVKADAASANSVVCKELFLDSGLTKCGRRAKDTIIPMAVGNGSMNKLAAEEVEFLEYLGRFKNPKKGIDVLNSLSAEEYLVKNHGIKLPDVDKKLMEIQIKVENYNLKWINKPNPFENFLEDRLKDAAGVTVSELRNRIS